ncbi:MAG: hypothetical protein J7L62_05520 [Candidatus Aminicenantes bacterium]|nr:hypothetical protein [Candidatus Aminicenantes bacterium]
MKEKVLFLLLVVGLLFAFSVVGAAVNNNAGSNSLVPSLNAVPSNVTCLCIYILGTDNGYHDCFWNDTNCVAIICPC